jgi:predicted outer membrane protein
MFMKCLGILAAGLLFIPVSAYGQGISDAQIAAIVVTANQVDIDAGQLALSRSTNDKVKTFAELMVTDHTGVNKAATDLVAAEGYTADRPDQRGPQSRRRQESRSSENTERCRVRSRLHQS